MIRTFLDAGVLIAAHRGEPVLKRVALTLIADPNRAFVASPFLRLELEPKALHFGNESETSLYRSYFDRRVTFWVGRANRILSVAFDEAGRWGLAAMDALHVAAAHLGGAEEFITTERDGKPIYRTTLTSVVSLDTVEKA